MKPHGNIQRRRFLTICAGAASLSFGARDAMALSGSDQVTRWRGSALGAEAQFELLGFGKQKGRELIGLARGEVARQEQIFSLHLEESELAKLNRNGHLENPSADLIKVLSTAATLHDLTGGIFDPTIQPLWQAYAEGFGTPDETARQAAIAKCGWQNLRFDMGEIRLANGAQLTLNGIAQGYITDCVAKLLKQNGVQNAFVEAGEIALLGRPDQSATWPVRIRQSETAIGLSDMAIATSSPLGTVFGEGTFLEEGGQSHLIDPRNHQPVKPHWITTSILHPSAQLADGLSTAAALMQPDEISAMVSRIGHARFIGHHRQFGEIRF